MEPETILNSTSILGLTLWLVRLSLTAGSAKDVVSATSGTGIGNSLVLFLLTQEELQRLRSRLDSEGLVEHTARKLRNRKIRRVGSPLVPSKHG